MTKNATPLVELPDDLKTLASADLNQAEIKAMIWLVRLLKETGAEWASEAQWRTYADRPIIQPEYERARGFRIPEMVEKGAIVSTTAVVQVARNGIYNDPTILYRPNL